LLGLLGLLQNVTFYREVWSISATQLRENEEVVVTGSPRSMCYTTGRPGPVLELGFSSFFAPRAWHNMDDLGGGQNIAIEE